MAGALLDRERAAPTGAVVLHDYWRSSASYRVRIALALKGIAYDRVVVDLVAGAQRGVAHLGLNPQGLVPALEIDGRVLTQSLAIIEYRMKPTLSRRFCPGTRGRGPMSGRWRWRWPARSIRCPTLSC